MNNFQPGDLTYLLPIDLSINDEYDNIFHYLKLEVVSVHGFIAMLRLLQSERNLYADWNIGATICISTKFLRKIMNKPEYLYK